MKLDQAGEMFSELLVEYSDKCFGEINNQLENDKKKNPEIDKKKELNIKKLFLFFFIHFIDRRAFSLLTHENRKAFMNPVGYMSIEKFIKNNSNKGNSFDQDSLLRNHIEELNLFVIKFNKFKKIFPSETDSPKDTLFWEFSKEISLAIDNTTDIIYMTLANDLTIQVISNLKVDEIIKTFK